MKTEYFIEETTLSSGTTTDGIDLTGKTLVGFFTPAGIASSEVKVLNAIDLEGTYVEVHDPLALYGTVGDLSLTIAADKFIAIPPSLAAGLINVKLVFGSAETNKTIKLVTRPID